MLSSVIVFKLFKLQKLWRSVFCSSKAYSPIYIKVNLEITASENCDVAPGWHVSKTLKNSDNSLFDLGVIVLGISSFTVILHFP